MKKILHIVFIFFAVCEGNSQVNLVPNFGFEEYTSCPTNTDQTSVLIYWSQYSASITTPDYYNACASSSTVGVPQSSSFYQKDNRNCSAYIGLVTWATTINDREHIGTQLTQPLVIGQKYYLSFYTVMGGGFFAGDYMESPSNNVGMRLSTVPFNPSNPTPIDNFAHLRSTATISDTANWVRISGSILADSAYNYLILGNFYDDANTDTTTLNCGACQNWYSYYLIDDVCISTDSTLCNGGIDLLPCTVSVEENNFDKQFILYPNPANDFVAIQGNFNTPFDISLFNSVGQQLYIEENVTSDNLQLDISHYNSGLVFIKIKSQNNQFMYKLLKK